MGPSRRPGGEGGFTLVEVMTAFTVLAIVAGLVFTVVAGASRRSRDLAREAQTRQAAAAVLSLVAEDVEGAFGRPPSLLGRDGFHRELPSDRLDLVTTSTLPLRPDALAGDLAEVGYRVAFEDDASSGTLFRREQVPAQPPSDQGGEEVELLDGVSGLSLRYFDGEEWLDEWDSEGSTAAPVRGRLPRLVQVLVAVDRPGAAFSVRTRVAPPMASGAGS